MKKLFSFFAIVIALSMNALVAQTPKSDSLREIVRRDTANFDALMELAQLSVDIDNAAAVLYAKRAKALSLISGDTLQLVNATRLIGQLENRLGNIDSAIQQFTFILPIAERNNCLNDLKKILNSLATSLTYKGEYGKALEYHFKSLVLREKGKNKQEISITLHNIASVYIASSNHEQALPYLEQSLKAKQEIQDSLDLDRVYLNIAVCHTELGNQLEARVNYDKALAVCGSKCQKYVLIMATYGIGETFFREHNYGLAKQHFQKSLALAIEDNNLQMNLFSLTSLAQLASDQGDVESLRVNLSVFQGLHGKEQFLVPMKQYYDLSSKYYVATRNFEKAFEFQKKYSDLVETTNTSKMNKKIMDMQLEFVQRENFQKIGAQQELLNAQNLVIGKQKTINLLFLGVALLTVFLMIILFKMNRRKNEINRVLDGLVRQRTLELERNGVSLRQSLNEQSIVLDRVCRDLVSSLATIQGLNHLASLEDHANAEVYLRGAEAALFRSISAIQGGVACGQSHS
jgi:adenylate cyclase